MKWINIITHPILVLVLFCGILISGEHFGGFYLMYILMALPHGGIHALIALLGIGLILLCYGMYKRKSQFAIDPLLNVLGVFSLYISLWLFFYNTWDYNEATFHQTIPVIILTLFIMISLAFLIRSIACFAKSKPDRRGLLT